MFGEDEDPQNPGGPSLSPRAKLTIIIILGLAACAFILQVRFIISPFLWALLAAYLLAPVVNYLNIDGGLPRLWAVVLVYASIGILLLAGSRYLYPRLVEQGTVFIEDIPRLEASLISLVGPRPMGLDIDSLVSQLVHAATGYTSSSKSASHLLINALETFLRVFLFLVTTFYLLMDSRRIKRSFVQLIPATYRPELTALGNQINLTWQQYLRGELLLFALMATATTIGLEILQVPGAIFLGIVSGALELLPLVGPITAGALAVSVAYFNGSNPWNLSQITYAGVVALMYFVFRQLEDYLVAPHVLGRAVRLHPIVVLFALTSVGYFGGLYGLLIAVPLAASLKAILSYIYAKLLDLPVQFEPVRTLGGGVIEIPVNGKRPLSAESAQTDGAGTPQQSNA